jgi:hypothetical protein
MPVNPNNPQCGSIHLFVWGNDNSGRPATNGPQPKEPPPGTLCVCKQTTWAAEKQKANLT